MVFKGGEALMETWTGKEGEAVNSAFGASNTFFVFRGLWCLFFTGGEWGGPCLLGVGGLLLCLYPPPQKKRPLPPTHNTNLTNQPQPTQIQQAAPSPARSSASGRGRCP